VKKGTWIFAIILIIVLGFGYLWNVASPFIGYLLGEGAVINELEKEQKQQERAKWVQIQGEEEVSILIGKKYYYTYTSQNLDLTGSKWSTSDSSVAKVDEYGEVEGLKEGKTTLTFQTKDGAYSDERTLNVYRKVKAFTIQNPEATITVGDTYKPSYTSVPKDAAIIPILVRVYPDGDVIFDGDGTLQLKPDGSVVGVKSGTGYVGFRYGRNQEKDAKTPLLDGGDGYIGVAKVNVVLGKDNLKKYLADVDTYIDRIKESTKKETHFSIRDETLGMGAELSNAQMAISNFKNLTKQINQTNADLELYYNTIGSKVQPKYEKVLFKSLNQLKKTLSDVIEENE
jgi:hypothetical protein